jgi:hypothetical protein
MHDFSLGEEGRGRVGRGLVGRVLAEEIRKIRSEEYRHSY